MGGDDRRSYKEQKEKPVAAELRYCSMSMWTRVFPFSSHNVDLILNPRERERERDRETERQREGERKIEIDR